MRFHMNAGVLEWREAGTLPGETLLMQVVYPNTWVAAEFREGVVAAFKHVNSFLANSDSE